MLPEVLDPCDHAMFYIPGIWDILCNIIIETTVMSMALVTSFAIRSNHQSRQNNKKT